MRFLITGVAGFIGSHIADRLIADGHEVAGIDNLTTGRRDSVHPDVAFVEADISKEVPGDGDVIIHCAASYDDRLKWHRDTDVNVKGGVNVAIKARELGARVIYFQTALIYGNNPTPPTIGVAEAVRGMTEGPLPVTQPVAPENSYAISKYAAGQYLRHSGVPLLEFRLANIYGPRNLSGPVPAFWKRITNGEPCTIVDSRRDFVYIGDLVELVAQAITLDATGTYHVSTGRDYKIGLLYEAVVDAMDAHGSAETPTFQPRGADDAPTILLDPSETTRDFGWRPTTELDEGVQAAVDWYEEHGVEDVYTHLENLAVKG